MFLFVVSIIILAFGLLNIKRVNKMFDKPSYEELDTFQETVFLHIDEEISNYEKEIKSIYEKEGKPMIDEVSSMLSLIDERLEELQAIEKRLDEKIVKLNQFKDIM